MTHLSSFNNWKESTYTENWALFPENMGEYLLSIVETSLSQGELCTIVTNKVTKGRKEALITPW